MKKIVLKATALAIGALVGGSAFAADATAAITLGSNTGVVTFAKELKYTSALALTPSAAAELNVKTALGFGISGSTTRYIRLDFNNAKLAAAISSTLETGVDVGTATTAGGSSIAISAGGVAGSNYVIYQVVTGAAQAQANDAVVTFTIPALEVLSTASDVTVTYSLHETGTSAVAGATSGTAILSGPKTGSIAKFDTGLDLTVADTATLTASVEGSFKTFLAGTNVISDGGSPAKNRIAQLGTVTYGAKAGVKGRDAATDVTLANLVAAGTKVVLTGDFSVAAGADASAKLGSVKINDDATCAATPAGTSATAITGTGASFTVNETAVTGQAICYYANGTSAIPVSTYKVRVDVTTDADATSGNLIDKDLGSIVHDGTELLAPFATIHPDYVSRVFLTNQHTADAPVSAEAFYDNGTSCTGSPVALADLKAGKQMEYKIADVCPTLGTSTGSNTTRMAVKFTIAAPKSKIEGVYNQYKKGDATFANGKTTDQTSYSLHRPVAN